MALKTYAFFSTEAYLLIGFFDDAQHETIPWKFLSTQTSTTARCRAHTKETSVRWDKFRQARKKSITAWRVFLSPTADM